MVLYGVFGNYALLVLSYAVSRCEKCVFKFKLGISLSVYFIRCILI